jgi:hypothetical protein
MDKAVQVVGARALPGVFSTILVILSSVSLASADDAYQSADGVAVYLGII